jgi:predicted ATP-dependent endonuclease of OLD family
MPRELTITDILEYFSAYVANRKEDLPDEQNWQKRIQVAFDSICSPKRYVGYRYREDDPLGAPVLQDGTRQYPLRQAASGEQVILEYITRLTWPTPAERNIVLIDEPEIHLHPAWIRQLYLGLPKIGVNNQYILTTHSRELRDRAAADNALVDLGSLGAIA